MLCLCYSGDGGTCNRLELTNTNGHMRERRMEKEEEEEEKESDMKLGTVAASTPTTSRGHVEEVKDVKGEELSTNTSESALDDV